MIKWFIEKNPIIDFYNIYHDEFNKSVCVNAAKSYLNEKLKSFRERMFEKLFKNSDELEMIDVLMKYFKKVGDADKMIDAACKKITQERGTKDKVKEREAINILDRKLAYLWYSLGRVFIGKGQPNFAQDHFKNLLKLLEAKADLWAHDQEEYKHTKAKADLQLAIAKIVIGEKTKTLNQATTPGKTETSIPEHLIRAIGTWKDLLTAIDEKLKALEKKYGLKELDFTKKEVIPGEEETKEETNQQKMEHNKNVESKLPNEDKKELKKARDRQERFAIYLTNGFFWLVKFGFMIDENPKEKLHSTIGVGAKFDAMKEMLDKIVDAVADSRKEGTQKKGEMDYSIQRICLDILKSNFKSIPAMSDLKDVFSDKQSKAADRFK